MEVVINSMTSNAFHSFIHWLNQKYIEVSDSCTYTISFLLLQACSTSLAGLYSLFSYNTLHFLKPFLTIFRVCSLVAGLSMKF